MKKYIEPHMEWIEDMQQKLENKLRHVRERSAEKIPYTADNGVHDDWKNKQIGRWTNGFWAGIMWLMYMNTGDERYKEIAEYDEEILDEALTNAKNLNHDAGFIWLLSAGANYRLFGGEKSENRILAAASALASRFNIKAGYIRAWNGAEKLGFSIIDCMMNLPLLYLASEITEDPRFKLIAESHAESAMRNHLRPDGSLYHVIKYDIDTGEVSIPNKSQGYKPETSSWSRGQAWAIYGFALSYIHTGKQEFLDASKRAAHYFIANTAEDSVPLCDFRAPAEPVYHDTSAGACAACGLIELAKIVPEYEKRLYFNAAMRILKAIEKDYTDWSTGSDAIITNGCEAYHDGKQDLPLIYGDYYFVEAIYKLRGGKVLLW